ncbi:MAG: MFS transporter [Solibacillus sp.]
MFIQSTHSNWKKAFFTIWSGQAISQLSSSVLQMAIVWYLIATTQSPVIVAISGIMAFLPQGLLGPFIGVFIDRYNRKVIMIVSDLVIALASLVLVVVGIFSELPVWLIMLVLFIRSVGAAFHTPSLQAVTPLIVPKDMLAKCSGYSQTLQSVSLIVSPGLAAVLFAVIDINYIILIDVIGALIAFVTLLIVKIPDRKRENTEVPNVLREALDGIRELKDKKLVGFMLLGALFNLFYMPLFVLFPMMPLSYFGMTEWHAGLVEIVFGVGMLVGAGILSFWGGTKNKVYTVMGSVLMIGVSLTISGILPQSGFVLFAVLSAFLGLATPYFNLQNVVFQQRIEEEYLGRVMSLLGSLMVIGTPIGIALSGVMAEYLGIEKVFFILGLLITVTSLLYWIIPSVRNSDKPIQQIEE